MWNLILTWVATAVISYALRPNVKPQRRPDAVPLSVDDFNVPTAEDGKEIPVLFGTREITGPNVVWYGDLASEDITETTTYKVKSGFLGLGSKKKTQTTVVGFRYFMGLHMGLVHGPVDSLNRIRVADTVVWQGAQEGSGSFQISQPEAFGGDSSEGGIEGTFTFENGKPLQFPSSYLQANLGTPIPAFRGVACALLEQMYIAANNPYLKPWAFYLTRTDVTTGGQAQWYLEKSAIRVNSNKIESEGENGDEPGQVLKEDPPGFFYYDSGDIAKCDSEDAKFGSLYIRGKSRLYPHTSNFGLFNIPDEWILSSATEGASGSGDFPTLLSSFCISTNSTMQVVRSPGLPSNGTATRGNPATTDTVLVVSISENSTMFTRWYIIPDQDNDSDGDDNNDDTVLHQSCLDMNPAHIIRECLTDKEWGMGYSEADIDDASFIAAADTLYDEKMGISILWQRENTIEAFIQDIIRHIDAALYVDRRIGKFVLKLIRADYNPASLITLRPDHIERIENYKRPAFGDLINSVTVIYEDCNDGRELFVAPDSDEDDFSCVEFGLYREDSNMPGTLYDGPGSQEPVCLRSVFDKSKIILSKETSISDARNEIVDILNSSEGVIGCIQAEQSGDGLTVTNYEITSVQTNDSIAFGKGSGVDVVMTSVGGSIPIIKVYNFYVSTKRSWSGNVIYVNCGN